MIAIESCCWLVLKNVAAACCSPTREESEVKKSSPVILMVNNSVLQRSNDTNVCFAVHRAMCVVVCYVRTGTSNGPGQSTCTGRLSSFRAAPCNVNRRTKHQHARSACDPTRAWLGLVKTGGSNLSSDCQSIQQLLSCCATVIKLREYIPRTRLASCRPRRYSTARSYHMPEPLPIRPCTACPGLLSSKQMPHRAKPCTPHPPYYHAITQSRKRVSGW